MEVKVVLCCANGFTTTMLCNKIREEAAKEEHTYSVHAYSLSELDKAAADADIILLGPQVRFNLSKVKKAYPNKPVLMIDSQALAFINGAAVLKQVKQELGL